MGAYFAPISFHTPGCDSEIAGLTS